MKLLEAIEQNLIQYNTARGSFDCGEKAHFTKTHAGCCSSAIYANTPNDNYSKSVDDLLDFMRLTRSYNNWHFVNFDDEISKLVPLNGSKKILAIAVVDLANTKSWFNGFPEQLDRNHPIGALLHWDSDENVEQEKAFTYPNFMDSGSSNH